MSDTFLLKRKNLNFFLLLLVFFSYIFLLFSFLIFFSLDSVNSYLRDTANGPRLFRQTVAEEFRQGENSD